jgi:hypothetical protein
MRRVCRSGDGVRRRSDRGGTGDNPYGDPNHALPSRLSPPRARRSARIGEGVGLSTGAGLLGSFGREGVLLPLLESACSTRRPSLEPLGDAKPLPQLRLGVIELGRSGSTGLHRRAGASSPASSLPRRMALTSCPGGLRIDAPSSTSAPGQLLPSLSACVCATSRRRAVDGCAGPFLACAPLLLLAVPELLTRTVCGAATRRFFIL